MSFVAGIVIVSFALCLIGFTAVVFVRPALAERFFMSFAASARAHVVEQVFRLLIGASLVVRSPQMWQPVIFLVIGWALVVSAVVLLVLPWQWHHRFGNRVLPLLVRYMRFYAAGMVLFAALLLRGVLGTRWPGLV
jgi:hypothetical protein